MNNKEIESVTITIIITTKKSSGLDNVPGKFFQTFKKELIPTFVKLLQKY